MKGVILGIQPGAQLVDISHGVEPYDIAGERVHHRASVPLLSAEDGSCRRGGSRRGIGAQAAAGRNGGQYFVAPDNGVLSMVFAREKPRSGTLPTSGIFCIP